MRHQRIDEGIARPRKRRKAPQRHDPQTDLAQAIPIGLDPKLVLDAYLATPHTSQIAAQFGVRRSSLTAWLRQVAPDDWRNVQLIRAHIKKENGDEGIEDAADAFELARAREMLRSGQWDLQVLDPDYAPKRDVTMNVTIDLGDKLRRAREREVEHDKPVALPQLPEIAQKTGNSDDNP